MMLQSRAIIDQQCITGDKLTICRMSRSTTLCFLTSLAFAALQYQSACQSLFSLQFQSVLHRQARAALPRVAGHCGASNSDALVCHLHFAFFRTLHSLVLAALSLHTVPSVMQSSLRLSAFLRTSAAVTPIYTLRVASNTASSNCLLCARYLLNFWHSQQRGMQQSWQHCSMQWWRLTWRLPCKR